MHLLVYLFLLLVGTGIIFTWDILNCVGILFTLFTLLASNTPEFFSCFVLCLLAF